MPEDRRRAVGDYLAEDDDAYQRVQAYHWQVAELYRWLWPVMGEPVPERLSAIVHSATGNTTCEVVAVPADAPRHVRISM